MTFADVVAELERIRAALPKRPDTPESRFVDAVRKHGVIAAHPRTLAALDKAEPRWRELFGAEAFPAPMFEQGVLYTGAMFTRGAETEE